METTDTYLGRAEAADLAAESAAAELARLQEKGESPGATSRSE